MYIGTWLHRYLNGGAIKTKTNQGLEKWRTKWRLTLILGGDYKKNKNKMEVNLDT